MSTAEMNYIRNTLGYYLPYIDHFASRRRKNYDYYTKIFSNQGHKPRFEMKAGHIPGVFIFTLYSYQNGQGLKEHLWRNGVEASVFYKENAVFIPVNHTLNTDDLDYIHEITTKYLYP